MSGEYRNEPTGVQKLGIVWADEQPSASQERMLHQSSYCNTREQWLLEHTVGGKSEVEKAVLEWGPLTARWWRGGGGGVCQLCTSLSCCNQSTVSRNGLHLSAEPQRGCAALQLHFLLLKQLLTQRATNMSLLRHSYRVLTTVI